MNFRIRSGAKACKYCGSRQELSNEYYRTSIYYLVFTCNIWRRYIREQASQRLPTITQTLEKKSHWHISHLLISVNIKKPGVLVPQNSGIAGDPGTSRRFGGMGSTALQLICKAASTAGCQAGLRESQLPACLTTAGGRLGSKVNLACRVCERHSSVSNLSSPFLSNSQY